MNDNTYVEFSGSDVTIMTCADCNAHCKHCYIGYNGNFDGDELFELCQKLKQKYDVRLNGTELLLHPEFFKSLEYVEQDFLITNGLAIYQNPELATVLAKIGVKYVGISYHFDTHDDISGIELSVINAAIHTLKQAGIIVDIRATIDIRNFDKIQQMCEEAISLGVNGIKFTNLMNTGNALARNHNYMLSDSHIEQVLCKIEKQRNMHLKEDFSIRRCGSFGPGQYREFFCPAGNKKVVVTPNLKVYPCIFWREKEWKSAT